MTAGTPRPRKTTTRLAPPPPRFPSVPPEYRSGDHLRLTEEDERALDEIWDKRAAQYASRAPIRRAPVAAPAG